jgi:hypothetical protein
MVRLRFRLPPCPPRSKPASIRRFARPRNLNADIVHNVRRRHRESGAGRSLAASPRRARKTLKVAASPHPEFGATSGAAAAQRAQDVERLADLPMVFVKGILIGGADQLEKMVSGGELKRMLGE